MRVPRAGALHDTHLYYPVSANSGQHPELTLTQPLLTVRGLICNKQRVRREQAITGLERDVAALKREVADRDATIGDKEKRIHDLKRKNQELEKFKFVLDYKIKELKRGIEPREAELVHLKGQIQARARCRRPAAASCWSSSLYRSLGATCAAGLQKLQAQMHRGYCCANLLA